MIEFLKKLFGFGDNTKKDECCPPVEESVVSTEPKLNTDPPWPSWPFPNTNRPEDQPKPSVADRKKRNLQKKKDAPKPVAAITAAPKVSLAPPSENAIKNGKKPTQQKKSTKK